MRHTWLSRFVEVSFSYDHPAHEAFFLTARLRVRVKTSESASPGSLHILIAIYSQIRVGPGAKPPMRGGTIEGTEEAISTEIRDIVRDMLGAVGNRKRKNLEVVRDELVASLRSGGSVDQQTGDILDYAFD